MSREFDIILFGASGFTGGYTVECLLTLPDSSISWALAGRNKDKIRASLDNVLSAKVKTKPGFDADKVEIIEADVADPSSLSAMCKRARVVITVVGPYRKYGEPLVQACIENRTHYVDISGEPLFLEDIQLRYSEQAKEAGVYVVGACGFDCIPTDLGLIYAKKICNGDLNSVDAVINVRHGPAGYRANLGTWESAVMGFSNAKKLKEVRKKLFASFPRYISNYKPRSHGIVWHLPSDAGGKLAVPLPTADRMVSFRTQKYNFETKNERMVPLTTYYRTGNWIRTCAVLLMGVMFGLMSMFSVGRSLLLKFPSLFSFGTFKSGGPSREQVKGTSFSVTMLCSHFGDKIADPFAQHDIPPSQELVVKVKGPDPGYVATSAMLVSSAITILKDKKTLPPNGGVYTSGAAFQNTSIFERLAEHNITFEKV